MEEKINKNPIKVFTCGPVKAAIWSDSRIIDDTLVEVHSIKIDRSYKDGDQWKHTDSFNIEDLPKVALVAMEAYRHVRLRTFEPGKKDEEDNHSCQQIN